MEDTEETGQRSEATEDTVWPGDVWPPEQPPAPAHPKRPRWWVLVVAVVPWVVVGVVWTTTRAPRQTAAVPATAATTPEPAPRPPSTSDDVSAAVPPTASPTAPGTGPAPSSGTRPPTGLETGPGTARAVGLAQVIARAWLTGVGPSVDVEGIEPIGAGYVDHLSVTGVERHSTGPIVVSLVVVLLHREQGHYRRASARSLAVPVHLDTRGVRPAGTPWWLPAPPMASQPLEGEDIDDVTLLAEAGAALTAAGYREVDVVSLERTPAWPYRVTAEAIAPGDRELGRHDVWLRRERDTLSVAGLAARPGATATPSPPPSAPESGS